MSGVLKKLERNFQSVDDTVTGVGQRMTHTLRRPARQRPILRRGWCPSAPPSLAPNEAGDFVQGLAAVGAATGATTRQMTALHDTALRAGLATQFSPIEAMDGLISLATAGQTATDAMSTLRPPSIWRRPP